MTTNPREVDEVEAFEASTRDSYGLDEQTTREGQAETETGLDENVAGALTYLLGVITGIVFYVVERDNQFVRFHAAQSIATFGLIFVASVGLSVLGVVVSTLFFTGSTSTFLIGSIVSLVLGLAWLVLMVGSFGLWIFLMVRAYQGKTPRIPIAATIADKLV